MSVEEGLARLEVRERLARLEVRADTQERWLQSIDGKVDQLVIAASLGKGAWLLILKIGAVITTVIGALAWLFDRFHR